MREDIIEIKLDLPEFRVTGDEVTEDRYDIWIEKTQGFGVCPKCHPLITTV
ncbi:MAG: hypothetical protein ACUVXI_19975 [bacterium]